MLSHIVYVPFRGVGIDNRNDEWFKERIEIFKNYTLKSLAAQTNKEFLVWLSFRPQDKFNPLTRTVYLAIREAGLETVFTFDGLMYVDDKFPV